MSGEDKVYCYLQSLDTIRNKNVGISFREPHHDTDTGIEVNYSNPSPKDDSSIPYLDISGQSPSFKIPFSVDSTSVKKTLFKEDSKSPEKKIIIFQNIILEPPKIQSHHDEVKSPNTELQIDSSKSFSSSSDNSLDVDYCIPSTSTSTDNDNLSNYSKPARISVSVFVKI